MRVIVVTGAGGLIGSEAVRFFMKTHLVVGIDNDMRAQFFGPEASTRWQTEQLRAANPDRFAAWNVDICNPAAIGRVFTEYGDLIDAVIHCAAQPSHDWAVRDPARDFAVNATGTLNMLEATRTHCPEAVFVQLSTNKVYGDTPNRLPLVDKGSRFDLLESHAFHKGVDESMSIDQTRHSLFGCSKLAADVYVQEYGRYFGMNTAILRGGCLTGPAHSGTELHGFLAYLMKCAVTGTTYRVIGYGGKQVRDNINSRDLVEVVGRIVDEPPAPGSVFNIGGGRDNSVSILEAISHCEHITGRKMSLEMVDAPRIGDHQWYITDNSKLMRAYPGWEPQTSVYETLSEIHAAMVERWA